MNKIKKYLLAIVIMSMISVAMLFIVTTFTYAFKWQANQAMIGIVVTYIFTGLAGGICLRWFWKKEYVTEQKNQIAKKAVEALILSTVFLLFLLLISVLGLQISFGFSGRLFMIWLLLFGATFLGRVL
ncbi:MAG: hypothetical protein J6J73_03095 [Agathobacter sp.]|nr:hypothetical protein [Agathobacter sp.]